MAEVAPQTHYAGSRRNMPFQKIGPNKYKAPSGKVLTKKQVRGYYATKGFKRAPRKSAKA